MKITNEQNLIISSFTGLVVLIMIFVFMRIISEEREKFNNLEKKIEKFEEISKKIELDNRNISLKFNNMKDNIVREKFRKEKEIIINEEQDEDNFDLSLDPSSLVLSF